MGEKAATFHLSKQIYGEIKNITHSFSQKNSVKSGWGFFFSNIYSQTWQIYNVDTKANTM